MGMVEVISGIELDFGRLENFINKLSQHTLVFFLDVVFEFPTSQHNFLNKVLFTFDLLLEATGYVRYNENDEYYKEKNEMLKRTMKFSVQKPRL